MGASSRRQRPQRGKAVEGDVLVVTDFEASSGRRPIAAMI
jgi:hypothetical protein